MNSMREQLDARPMSRYQWLIVALATFLMGLDGYDVQAMAFTANAVSHDMGLTSTELGLLLSGGLIGMALGAMFVGPFADRFGRRKMLLAALIINCAGLFLSATATSMPELMTWRIITGLGVGGILASGTVLVSEYSNAKYRGLSLSIYAAGYPVIATVGGLLAVPLIQNFGWQSVFLLGGILTVAAIALVAAAMPESLEFLAVQSRRGAGSADQTAARIAERLGLRADLADSPAAQEEEQAQPQNSYAALFSSQNLRNTLFLWAVFFIVMFAFYFANTWTPQLLTEVGFTAEEGIMGGVMLMLGGAVGAVLYGVFTAKWDPRAVLAVFATLSGVMFIVFISSTNVYALALITGVGLGMIVNGCISGLYTLAPMTYSPKLRSTGVGAALGVGRCGAILAPIIVGTLLDSGWTPTALYTGAGLLILLAAGAGLMLRLKMPRKAPNAEAPAAQKPEQPAPTVSSRS
ncbi:MFS transporter [Nesterenkonia populi]|uniref:MFS transporter n=1 Tax=Nesterenkonia populi TaxID=1591087 RepID=UPI001B883C13|nr:MFS transporter [Nesterenkonia populi]